MHGRVGGMGGAGEMQYANRKPYSCWQICEPPAPLSLHSLQRDLRFPWGQTPFP